MNAKLTPILQAVKEILKPAGLKGMHVDDIAAAAVVSYKNMGLSAEEFSRRIQSSLSAHLRLKTKKKSFARVNGIKKGVSKKGWYRVKVEQQPPVVATIEVPETHPAYLGKAGEMAVMSELLFWNYNASAMIVDSGIDIIASNSNGKYFHLQVKTSTENNGRFYFSIKSSAFQQNHHSNTFYVFVLRRKINSEFIVIPSHHIQTLVASGRITAGSSLSITITVDDKRHKYLLNADMDVSIFVGRFGQLV